MRTVTRVLIAAALAFGLGCASTDWIDRTLVTVDVTGGWEGSWSTGRGTGEVHLTLQQRGPKVTGQLMITGTNQPDDGDIEGMISGDLFTFRQTGRGRLSGELQVKGDEMTSSVVSYMKMNLHRQK
jgi:hypothetical protein